MGKEAVMDPGARSGRSGARADGYAAVEVEGLRKSYGSLVAVDGLSFTVERGTILALLGPNGAGKTSALECIEGIKRPDSGRIRVMGAEGSGLSRSLAMGVQLQSNGLPAAMTPREAMKFFAGYRGRKADLSAAERFGLGPKMDSPYASLSEGQKRRLSLALATAHSPSVLILDEPTAALDVESRSELHSIIGELKEGGAAIILASHDMAEVEKLADAAVVMLGGKTIARGSPNDLRQGASGSSRLRCSSVNGSLLRERPPLPGAALQEPEGERPPLPGAAMQEPEGERAVYRADDPGRAVTALVSWLASRGDTLSELSVEPPTLEERFMELVRRTA